MKYEMRALALAAGLIAVGCGDDDGTTPEMDMGPAEDMMVQPDGDTPDQGIDLGPVEGDGNDSFDTATDVAVGTVVEDVAIGEPGDHDFYSFTAEADQWILIATEGNPDDDPEMIDTVITLYDGSMNQIAENDDAIPRFNTDSELVIHVPAAGTYYVEVQEFSDWAGEDPEGMASFAYALTIAELDPSLPAVNIDEEAGDEVADAQAATLNTSADGDFAYIAGTLRDGSDVDVFTFTVSEVKPYAQFEIMPAGTEGNGSTAVPTALWVTDEDGTEIIARVSPDTLTELSPGLDPGTYQLWVEHGGSAGSNDFYVLKHYRFPTDNPPETSEVTNDVALTPEALTLADADGDGVKTGFIKAELLDGDTNHYSIAVEAGEVVSVFCGSRTAGSGVIDLMAELTDSTGTTVIDSATETATEAVAIEEADVGGAGTFLLRLTKGGQDAEVTGDWVRCGVAVGPPST